MSKLFELDEDLQKLRTKTLTVSGMALFISITGALPEKISLIGLDLSGNEKISGWFLFVLLAYFTIRFIMLSTFEFFQRWLPNWVNFKSKNLRGDTLGLTQKDLYYEQGMDMLEAERKLENLTRGATFGQEQREIDEKRSQIELKSKTLLLKSYGLYMLFIDFLLPILISLFACFFLYRFLC